MNSVQENELDVKCSEAQAPVITKFGEKMRSEANFLITKELQCWLHSS